MHYGIVQQAWENWFVILIMYVFWYGTALWKNKQTQTNTHTDGQIMTHAAIWTVEYNYFYSTMSYFERNFS